ncbi:MAG: histidine phosphatase family protein [Micrococcales bacterium]|nr:histidine phosphatase family protein [Micrococcales bacterium]
MSHTRRLVLLRHAKAEQAGRTDHERPLALAGRRQATAVGTAMRAEGVIPDVVLCSSALRTRQTWDLVCCALGPNPDGVVYVRDELYDAGPRDVLDLLAGAGEARTVLVVGHEPTMSSLAVLLAGPDSSPEVVDRVSRGVPTASWSLLELDAPWDAVAAGGARLRGLRVPARD